MAVSSAKMDVLLLSPALAVVSFAYVLVRTLLHLAFTKTDETDNGPKDASTVNGESDGVHSISESAGRRNINEFVRALDGPVIVALKSARLLAVLALLLLSIFQVIIGHQLKTDFAILAYYVYTSCLAAGSLFLQRKWRDMAARQLCALLLITFSVYFARDAWPLATFDGVPRGVTLNWFTWARVALLGLAGVVIPVVMPRAFVPSSPEDIPNTQDTASLLSWVTYDFMDFIIFYAYRAPALTMEDLPPVSWGQRALNLAKNGFPHLDPIMIGNKRHVFWGVLRAFRRRYTLVTIYVFLYAFAQFISPFGLNKLLAYLEDGRPATGVRPWVWIIVIAISPMVTSAILNQYIYQSSQIGVEGESLFTQLIFEHALRIRMKTDTLDKKSSKSPTPSSSAPSTIAVAEEESTDVDEPGDSTESIAETSDTTTVKVEEPIPEGGHAKGKSAHLIGKINNLLTSDLSTLISWNEVLFVPSCVLQIFLAIAYLYTVVGWRRDFSSSSKVGYPNIYTAASSAFVGLGIIIIGIPIPTFLGKLIMTAQKTKMEKTDQRVQAVTETMNVLRMVKLFAWELRILEQLTAKRDIELRWIRYGNLVQIGINNMNEILPMLSMLATFATYTLIMKQPLIASRAFTAISVRPFDIGAAPKTLTLYYRKIFNILSEQMSNVLYRLPDGLRAKVSFDRLNEYINSTELLSNMTLANNVFVPAPASHSDVIGFNAATFSWGQSDPVKESTKHLSKQFLLRSDTTVIFKRGVMNLIVGPTASGKTSLLMALLGEMYYKPHGPDSWYNLPREGGIAYAAQETWVLNETIRDNILFGEAYDEERYRKVLRQCALERDLSLWEAGDQTEVGEKGLTLSGGQKARLTLARAIYSKADVLLLDDVLAALDVHTAKWVVEEAFKGDLIRDRTVLLVTHNVALAGPVAEHVVALGRNGRVISQGSMSDALKRDPSLRAVVEKFQADVDKGNQGQDATDEDTKKETGKLVIPEEKALGRVEWKAVMLFVRGFGGPVLWLAFMTLSLLNVFFTIGQNWFIGYWSAQYESTAPEQFSTTWYINIYGMILMMDVLLMSLAPILWAICSVRASRYINSELLKSIINAPLRWSDVVPVGRVITRCTQDMHAIDGPVSQTFKALIQATIVNLTLFVTTTVMAGVPALVSGAFIASMGGWLGYIYLKAQISIRREMSNAKSPIMSQVGAALAGLPSIRAYGAQAIFRVELAKRIDQYTRAALTFYNINRWISFRANALGGVFSATVTGYMVYIGGVQAGAVGFILTIVLSFARNILYWVRLYNRAEIQSNSLERILEFLRIPQEPKPVPEGKPPAYWPASGSLRVEGLSARYADDAPEILHNISFEVLSGERVGVVGRTGAGEPENSRLTTIEKLKPESGKSTIALALLRAIKTSGKVYYDGIATDTLNLDALRSSVTVIPQQPELLRGTLRENLDPFSQYDDATLNDALRSAGLYAVQEREQRGVAEGQPPGQDEDEQRGIVGLDSSVDSGGTNFSLGQRQIIALARAIVRQSRLLILDEATAAIDYETDTTIQKSLRTELSKETSVITIAHRLQTIMDSDKIMVLDAGHLVEYDTPKNLLKNEQGFFRSLVDESDDKRHLMSLAGVEMD